MMGKLQNTRPDYLSCTFVLVYLFSLPIPVFAADITPDQLKGKDLYQTCIPCHGKNAEGSVKDSTPRLAGQYDWYLKRQLKNFKTGKRGYHSADRPGVTMGAIAVNLKDKQIDELLAYISTLSAPPNKVTVTGRISRGRRLYSICKRCHRKGGEGRQTANTPNLFIQHDWYVLRQLVNYRRDYRGTKLGDNLGLRMGKIAKEIPDEAALTDLVAYIKSLDISE